MMIILVFSLFCFVFLFSFLSLKKKIEKIFLLFIGICLFLLAAFRDGDVLSDYGDYVNIYEAIRLHKVSVESSFSFIAWIVRYIFFDKVIFLFIIYALLGVILKLKAIKELTPLIFLSLVIYISKYYILHDLIQIRVGVASGLLLLCIKPIYERNLKSFLFFLIGATFFHISALVIVPLWFLKVSKINKYIYVAIIPVSYLFYFLNINMVDLIIKFIPIDFVQQKYNYYLIIQQNGVFSERLVFGLTYFVRCLIYLVLLWKSNSISLHNKYINLLLKIEAFSLASFVMFFSMPVLAGRISELFGIIEIILIPCLYYVFKPKLLSKLIVIVVGICLILISIFRANLIRWY
jgi:hypothetical protein